MAKGLSSVQQNTTGRGLTPPVHVVAYTRGLCEIAEEKSGEVAARDCFSLIPMVTVFVRGVR